MYRFATRPRWVIGHVLVLAAMVAMLLLGHWQLTVSNRKHFNLQNFGYAIQWWLFTICAGAIWLKIVRDQAGVLAAQRSAPLAETTSTEAPPAPIADAPVAYRRYVMPQAADGPIVADDDVQADYNTYLASLADQPEKAKSQKDSR